MVQKLTNNNYKGRKGSILNRRKDIKFQIAITDQLEKDFCFKHLKGNHLKSFQRFLNETVNKRLSISQVDDMYLRKKGSGETKEVNNKKFNLIHYGKDQKSFRIFGYYNPDDYFVITRIDPKHKTHK